MTVLIIDDDPAAADALERLLHSQWKIEIEPLEVLKVRSLAEGLAAAARANVTILDAELPDSSRYSTISHIRSFRPPVIVLSGYASNDDKGNAFAAECLRAGADHVFAKGQAAGLLPAVFESLQKDIIRRAAERHQPATTNGVG